MNELKVNNKIISTPIIDILQELKRQLNERGIDKLKTIKVDRDDIMITCPIHKDGRENRPSCGVRKYGGRNSKGKDIIQGQVHCFTCGYTVLFPEFISNCFGYDDNGAYGERWLIDTFESLENASRDVLQIPTRERTKLPTPTYVSEEELNKYRYVHPYMYKRKLTDEIIEKFDIGYDKDWNGGAITFPVNDEKGNCVFVARRSIVGKYFNYPADSEKPVYALDKVLQGNYNSVYVCESFFNALTLWSWGYPAIALMGTGTDTQYQILKKTPIRNYILCFDGDDAGAKGDTKFRKALGKVAIISSKILPSGKDVNDLDKAEFDSLEQVI